MSGPGCWGSPPIFHTSRSAHKVVFIGLFRDFRDKEVLKTILKCRFHIFENVFFNFYRPQRVEKGSNYVLNLISDPINVKHLTRENKVHKKPACIKDKWHRGFVPSLFLRDDP